MKAKDLNRVQSVVKKSESETLTGAIKSWCRLFNSKQHIKLLDIVLLLNTLMIKAVISLFTIMKDINLLEWLLK